MRRRKNGIIPLLCNKPTTIIKVEWGRVGVETIWRGYLYKLI